MGTRGQKPGEVGGAEVSVHSDWKLKVEQTLSGNHPVAFKLEAPPSPVGVGVGVRKRAYTSPEGN